MGAKRFEDAREASWANETLPLSLRRELLAQELERLGFGPVAAVPGPVRQAPEGKPGKQGEAAPPQRGKR